VLVESQSISNLQVQPEGYPLTFNRRGGAFIRWSGMASGRSWYMRIIGSTFPAARLDAARAFLSDAPQPPSSVIVAAARKAAESVRPA
jgi:hypothetical protein